MSAVLNFLPDLDEEEVQDLLKEQRSCLSRETAETFLNGIFNKKLASVLLKAAKIRPERQAGLLTKEELNSLVSVIREFVIPVKETNPFEQAQICAGGVDTTEIEAETMQSKRVPGLYMVGELLDVDGICGGYNLQWAWSSGYAAGSHAAAGSSRIQKNCPGTGKTGEILRIGREQSPGKTGKGKNIHMIRINQLTLPVDHAEEAIKKKAAKLLKIDESAIGEIQIVHRSIDARKKPNLLFSYIVDVTLAGGKKRQQSSKGGKPECPGRRLETICVPGTWNAGDEKRPVIIGAGPAGMFAALALAENGYAPILLNREMPLRRETKKVEDFWKNGDPALDIRSNVQFGEGGAGTFSDGKLNTLVKDTSGRNGKVLSTFVEMGADPSILYDHAPHIGTDVLREVVRNLRNRIIAGGGEVHFRSEVTEILEENGRVSGVKLADGTVIGTEQVILSVGHSARDLLRNLTG